MPLEDTRHELDTIAQLENAVTFEKHRYEALLKEKRVVDGQLRTQEKEIERLNALVDQIKLETGWTNERISTAGRSPTNSPDIKGHENKIGELAQVAKKLEDELKTERQISRKKTQLIESLTLELDHKKKVEEELFQAKNMIKVREREAKDAVENLRVLERTYAKRDKPQDNDKNEGLVRNLEADKKYLQSENAKLVEARRQLERTVKSHQQKIDALESRMATINTALKDTKRDKVVADALRSAAAADTSVNASATDATAEVTPRPAADSASAGDNVIELLQADVQRLRNALRQKDNLIREKDQNIESLERKVDVLSHAKRTEVRQASAGRKGLATQIEELKKAMQTQEEQFKENMDRAKAENLRLKNKLRDMAEA